MPGQGHTGPQGEGFRTGRGLGRCGGKGNKQESGWSGGKRHRGPSGNCVCPKCGHKEPHVAGQRCMDKVCPKCGTRMVRE